MQWRVWLKPGYKYEYLYYMGLFNTRLAEVIVEMCYDRWLSTSFPNTLSVRNREQGT